MKRNTSIVTRIGAFIFVVYALLDRFIIEIPDIIAIPIMILGIVLMLIGNIRSSKDDISENIGDV